MRQIDIWDIRLQQIQMFLTVAEMGSITKASEFLHLSPSTLSKNIAMFEQDLGILLFVRSKKKLQITPAAKILVKEFNAATNLIQNAIEKAHLQQAEQTGHLTLGITDICNQDVYILPSMRNFLSKYTYFKYFVESYTISSLPQKLLSGEIDIAFSALYEKAVYDQMEDINVAVMLRYPFMVDISYLNPLSQKDFISISELKEMNFIVPSPVLSPLYYGSVIEPLCSKYGYIPKIKHFAASTTALLLNLRYDNDVTIVDCSVNPIPGYKRVPLYDTESGTIMAWRKDSDANILLFVNETIDYWKSHTIECN
jgi:molybdenum-dependent DNA-binding transcriptional regulator ModE